MWRRIKDVGEGMMGRLASAFTLIELLVEPLAKPLAGGA